MKKKVSNKIIIIIVFIFIIYLFQKVEVLELKNFDDNKVIKSFINYNGEFEIIYIHSVMLSEVTEKYITKNTDIYLVQSTIKDFGAGLPSDTPYKFEYDRENKIYRISEINLKMDSLIYKVGTKRANHRIKIKDDIFSFKEFAQERSSIEFKTKNIYIWRYYLEKIRR